MEIDQKIIESLGIGNSSEDARQRMVQNVKSIIDMRLMLMVDEFLTDSQRADFEKVQEMGDTVGARLWLEKNVVNTQELYQSLLDDYLEEKRQSLQKLIASRLYICNLLLHLLQLIRLKIN